MSNEHRHGHRQHGEHSHESGHGHEHEHGHNHGHGKPYPLALADAGARVRIVTLSGGNGMERRLTEMGLNIGAEIIVRQREGGGIVVMRGETRYALGGGMAHRIMVASIGGL